MNKFKFYIFIFVSLFCSSIYAQHCKLKTDLEDQMEQFADVIYVFHESPFMIACAKSGHNFTEPVKSSLLSRQVPESDSRGNLTREFLEKVIKKIEDKISKAKKQNLLIKKCIANDSVECADTSKWIAKDLPQFISKARMELALSQSEFELKSYFNNSSKEVNAELNTLGSYKLNKWKPLTQGELKFASRKLEGYKKKIREEGEDAGDFDLTLYGIRQGHFLLYLQTLSHLPLLQYLSGPTLNHHELVKAIDKMNDQLDQEMIKMADYKRMMNRNGPLSPEALNILLYGTEVEEVLLNENKYCGLATSLVYTKSDRELGNALIIGLPILLISIVAPPAILSLGGTSALGVGVSLSASTATSAGFALTSFNDLKSTQQRTLSYICDDSTQNKFSYAKLDRDNDNAKMSLAMFPVSIAASHLINKIPILKDPALSAAKRILFQSNNFNTMNDDK